MHFVKIMRLFTEIKVTLNKRINLFKILIQRMVIKFNIPVERISCSNYDCKIGYLLLSFV